MSELSDVVLSFDAHDWAREFCRIGRTLTPPVEIDEGWALAWFASALMRGYDERHWQTPEYKAQIAAVLTGARDE